MPIKIGRYYYRKASDLTRILERAPRNEKEVKVVCYLLGIYASRVFGIVRYIDKIGYDTDKISIGKKLSECKSE